jgi:putative transposase
VLTPCQTQSLGNGYIESFNARLRNELLNGEIFYTLREAQIVIESWRRHYNTIRAPRLDRIQTTSTRGVRVRIRRVVGCATPPPPPATLAQRPTLN